MVWRLFCFGLFSMDWFIVFVSFKNWVIQIIQVIQDVFAKSESILLAQNILACKRWLETIYSDSGWTRLRRFKMLSHTFFEWSQVGHAWVFVFRCLSFKNKTKNHDFDLISRLTNWVKGNAVFSLQQFFYERSIIIHEHLCICQDCEDTRITGWGDTE